MLNVLAPSANKTEIAHPERISDLRQLADWQHRHQNRVLALVPTMGNLHTGHGALVEEAKKHADLVMLYIYVNPAQFAPHEDFGSYPRTLEADIELCQQWGVNAVFTPSDAMIYPHGKDDSIRILPPPSMNQTQYAQMRPDFFAGVTTVLTRMFTLVRPNIVVFGDKDAQQRAIVERLIQELFLPITLIGIPTIREADGLAMSSRNTYLTHEDRPTARILSQLCRAAVVDYQSGINSPEQLEANAHKRYQAIKADYPDFSLTFFSPTQLDTFDRPAVCNDDTRLITAGTLRNIYLIDCLRLGEEISFPKDAPWESAERNERESHEKVLSNAM